MYMYIVCILIDPFYTQPIKIALRTGAVGGGWGGGGVVVEVFNESLSNKNSKYQLVCFLLAYK